MWAGATVLGVGNGLRLNVTAVGTAVDNEKTSSSHCQRILCHARRAAVVREARRGCCVMLEAQLAESSNSQERASAGSLKVS